MSETPVIVDDREGVRVITLNRPEKLNSFNEAMHAGLAAALDEATTLARCGAVVITGAGRGFCAGQDLGDRRPDGDSAPRDLGATLDRLFNPLVRRIRGLPKPVVMAVNGVAAGAGANVALAGDIVIAARSARFIQAFVKIGLIPDCGGTWTLTRVLGQTRAKALMMTGDPIGAEQAAEWGLIWQAVDDEKLMEEAVGLAGRLAQGPATALRLIKQATHAAATNDLDAQLDLERDLQREAGRHPDYNEGVLAFLEKRPAKFSR